MAHIDFTLDFMKIYYIIDMGLQVGKTKFSDLMHMVISFDYLKRSTHIFFPLPIHTSLTDNRQSNEIKHKILCFLILQI